MGQHKYSQEEIDFLRDNAKGRSYEDLRVMFNKQFGVNFTFAQISGTLKRNNLKNGIHTSFSKGNIPHNKGKKGVGGWEPTQFKTGNKPHNYKSVGTERFSKDGYLEVKIQDPNKWRPKHLLIWEEANGPMPKGHAVIFGDGDKTNICLENLILVSRRELLVLNKRGLIRNDVELTKTAVLVADLYLKMADRKKGE